MQAKKNVWIVAINEVYHITDQVALDEIQSYHNQCGKSKVKIRIFRSENYQRTDLEEIRYIFYLVRPVFSHLEVRLPEKPLTLKNIGEYIKGP